MVLETAAAEIALEPAAGGTEAAPFEAAGRRVLRRVLWRRWLGGLMRAFWPALAALLLLAVWAALGGGLPVALAALAWPLALGLAAAARVWRRRPSVYAALALWDRQTGRREAFAAAWWFEGLPERSAAETAHWREQSRLLPKALGRLREDLPLPRWRPLLALPLLGAAALWAGGAAEARKRGPELTPEMVAAAASQAEVIARLEKKADQLSALEEQERAALRQQLSEAARELENSAGKTARELMDALERKARETEKLAQRLAAESDRWASPELTEALRRQADTADLGDAVADRNAAVAAAEAEEIAGQLEGASDAQAERLQEVFAGASAAVQPEDHAQPVGEAVTAGAKALDAGQSADAAAAMRELARRMRDLEKRRQTQQELEQLAQQLRDAASRAVSAPSGEVMQALAQAGELAASQGQEGSGAQAGAWQPDAAQPGQQGAGELAMPSSSGQQGDESGGSLLQGQKQDQPSPMMGVGERPPGAGQGDGKPDPGAPFLLAPVPPGGKPDDKPPEMAVLLPGGASGGGQMGAGSGLPPGAGTAKLGEDAASEATASAKQALVQAQSSKEGASELRQVEGGAPRDEAAERAGASLSVEFLEAQEAALDEAALPAARREQVRRYFNALRQRLETR